MSTSNEFTNLLNLPSKCLTYKGVDKNNIFIRQLKGKDEKLLSEISGDNFEKKFLTLLRNVTQGLDVEQLTLGDRLFIAIWLAMNSYSDKFYLKYECPDCWVTTEYEIDLKTLEVKELPDDYSEPYEIKLIQSGQLAKVRLLTLKDIIKAEDMAKSNQNVWLFRYALALEFPEGNVFDKVSFLEELPTQDLVKIRAFQDKFWHGPVMAHKYECPKCGGAGIMPVPFQFKMVFPYGEELTRNFGTTI